MATRAITVQMYLCTVAFLTITTVGQSISLISKVEDHLRNGGSCSSFIENYSRTIRANSEGAYLKILPDAALNAARIDVREKRQENYYNNRLKCVPLIIQREPIDNSMNGNNHTNGKSMIIDYFKNLGAVSIFEYYLDGENNNFTLPISANEYGHIVLHLSLNDRGDLKYFDRLATSIFADSTQKRVQSFGKTSAIRRRNGDHGNDKCGLHKVTSTFRINSLRENVAVTTNSLNDAIYVYNATASLSSSLDDTESDQNRLSINRKKIGLINMDRKSIDISMALGAKIVNLLFLNGALHKNVSLNGDEMTSLLNRMDNLTDCATAAPPSGDFLCWAAIKKRYRLRNKFVKRVVEPMIGNNDLLITWRTDNEDNRQVSIGDRDEMNDFFQMLKSVDYPMIHLTWKCAKGDGRFEHVRLVARPSDRLDTVFTVARLLDNAFTQDIRSSNSVRSVNVFHRDYCGQIVLNEISDGPTLFAYELCSPNGLCVNTRNGFRCECVPGFGGRFCNKIVSPFTIIQKCVLYPTYQTVINNLTGACPDQTTCVPYAHHCLLNYCENPHGWCLPVEELRKNDNSRAR